MGSTSLGVAASHGLLEAAREIATKTMELARCLRGLRCLVSMDIEDGFFDDPTEVAGYVRELDVHGINLEDSSSCALVDPELHAAKISEVKQLCPEVFINARIDTGWLRRDIDITRPCDGPGSTRRPEPTASWSPAPWTPGRSPS